jgi:hypothetical protein
MMRLESQPNESFCRRPDVFKVLPVSPFRPQAVALNRQRNMVSAIFTLESGKR